MAEDSPLLTPEDHVAPTGTGPAQKRLQGGVSGEARNGNGAAARPDKRKLDDASAAVAGGAGLARTDSTLSRGTPTPQTSSEKYKKIKLVGTGAYGKVYKAENLDSGDIVAVKQTTRKEDPIWGGFPVSLLREIAILRSLRHDNIVQLHDLVQTPSGDALMVMEYCESSLQELLNSRKSQHDLSFSEVKYIIRQVLDACRHMHERGILHRDLATKNVLFNLSGEIKVCDFGISRFAFGQDEEFGFVSAGNLENPNQIVSLPYRAIELLLGQADYGPALDVWAAGAILGEILLCQGGLRRTFFGGDPDAPNKTQQATVEEIFSICGRPTEQSWPGLSKLPLLKSYASGSGKLDRLPPHSGVNEERIFLRRFFSAGVGKCAHSKYSLTEACFDLLGNLLTLCPKQRQTAEVALRHGFFSEKPMPEWHREHWSLQSSEIARGDDMRRQERDSGDDKRAMLRKLSSGGEDLTGAAGEARGELKTAKERRREELEKRANENKQQEERRKRLVEGRKASEESLPPGWTKHWSNTRQRYYYHDAKSNQTRWSPPSATGK